MYSFSTYFQKKPKNLKENYSRPGFAHKAIKSFWTRHDLTVDLVYNIRWFRIKSYPEYRERFYRNSGSFLQFHQIYVDFKENSQNTGCFSSLWDFFASISKHFHSSPLSFSYMQRTKTTYYSVLIFYPSQKYPMGICTYTTVCFCHYNWRCFKLKSVGFSLRIWSKFQAPLTAYKI